jgi:hypothetical protein
MQSVLLSRKRIWSFCRRFVGVWILGTVDVTSGDREFGCACKSIRTMSLVGRMVVLQTKYMYELKRRVRVRRLRAIQCNACSGTRLRGEKWRC